MSDAQPVAYRDGPGSAPDGEQSRASGIERRRHPRAKVDLTGIDWANAEGDRRQNDRRQGDRRQGDRRMDERRSDVGWTVAGNRGRGAKSPWRLRMKASRVFVLLVAAGSGSVAAYLALQREPSATPAPVEVVQATTAQVLVASRTIAVGQRLSPAALAWQDWPLEGVNADFVTVAAAPAAVTDMSGYVARSDFLPGDPIRKQKLAQSDSFLPAILDGGMRGVSVAITAESAAGGFIRPNDRVDVVLTRAYPGSLRNEGNGATHSETILHNVQVLAIDSRVGRLSSADVDPDAGDVEADTFTGQAIATLALASSDAEIVVNASAIGTLSLLLRSATDVADDEKRGTNAVNRAIRISSPFWSR